MSIKSYAAAVIASACLATSAASAAELTLGGIFSLTGPAAFIGTAERDGMLLAIDEINAKGLLGNGNTVKLLIADDANERAQVITLVNRYAADPAILAIAGPTTGATSPTAASAANEKQIPMIATSNSPSILQNGPWSFITTQLAVNTIPYIVDYAVGKAKVKACGIIGLTDNENYVALQKTVIAALEKAGQKIAFEENVKTSDTDFSAIATKVATRTGYDCLFVSAPAPQAANIIMQLKGAGLDPAIKLFGHNSLASPQFADIGGKAVEGAYLMGEFAPGGATPEGREFVKNFFAKFKAQPDNWNAFGYAKMYVIADALKRAGAMPTRLAIRDAFTATKDVPVILGTGKYSLDANRAPQFGMVVMQVKDGKFVPAGG